jgi:hypothetical protein
MAQRAEVAIAATTQTVGRFAPVMGALQFPSSSDRLIDFVNPRKKVEQKKPIGRYILGAAAAVGLLGACWWWYSSSHAELDQQIKLLKDEVAGDGPILKTSSKNLADWKKVESFMQGDILWIDELERLSTNAKDSDTTYFGGTTFNLEPRTNTATIATKFFTKEQDLVPQIQLAYRDEKHNVRGTGLAQSQDKKYPVAADMSITVAAAEVKDPRNIVRKPVAEPKAEEVAQPPVAEIQTLETPPLEPSLPETAGQKPNPAGDASTAPREPAPGEPKPGEPSLPENTNPQNTEPEPASPAAEPILGGAS